MKLEIIKRNLKHKIINGFIKSIDGVLLLGSS